MQTTVKERIISFIEFKKISLRGFEARCGLSNGYLRQLRNSPTADKVEMILSAFPELRREWLMTGEGEMLKDSSTNVGEISGNENTVGMTVTQTIGENSGQNAGRDINNPPCPYGEQHFMAELEAQRKLAERQLEVYSTSLSQRDEQIRAAQSQIDTLIKQNQEQFNRFMSLLEMMQKA